MNNKLHCLWHLPKKGFYNMLGNDFWYKSIKRYFELGCYSPEDVQKYYAPLNKITEEQYKEIVGIVEEPKEETTT